MIVTPLYAGLLALWFFVLSFRIVRVRRADSVSLGDGGNAALLRRIRAQANFAEYVPMILLMMAMLELSRFPGWLLHALGLALLIGRLAHGYALSFTGQFMPGRVLGAALTFTTLVVAGSLCVWQGVRVMLMAHALGGP